MRVLGYIRVSTEEQAESRAGLDAQRDAIGAEAALRDDFELVDVICDAGYSAADMKRPGLQEALRRLKAKEADGLVVAKLDRLSRSVMDFAQIGQWAEKQKWAIILLDFGLDTSTPVGEMMATLLAIFAQFERRMIAERTRDAMAAKKRAGTRFGRPKSLPEEIRLRLLLMYSGGQNYSTIAEILNEEGVPTAHGGKKWWPATVRSILQSAWAEEQAA